ncbi:MAG: glycosyltransferase [Thauera sp.]|jgi:GT2 family glycosyltransferase/glycosyltransferase involved in cell wall biosynthesis|nr:glycosyltransferase [Thauera sp.]
MQHLDETPPAEALIDVIIPVYRGYALTRSCIESVLANRQRTPFELVVIDDCSPEPALSTWLQETAASGQFTLLRNEHNRGFVATVNRGMALHPERDVVLLNSDAEVANDWLDRLWRCAYRAADIATVTPFSNNATICSYPNFAHGSELLPHWPVAALDALCARHNAGASVDIPTAVGFCMYIRRASLQAVGLFDENAFGKGYGEENDFCLRASAAGWRHLLAADCFVGHIGSVSFGDERHALQQAASKVLLERHPHYAQQVADFIATDPIHPYRKSVDIARLASCQRPVVLLLSHERGGGVDKHLEQLVAQHGEHCELLGLQPAGEGWVSLRWLNSGEHLIWGFRDPHGLDMLEWVLSACHIERIYIHHLIGFSITLVERLLARGPAYEMMLHDYYYFCPQIHLNDAEQRYCGEPALAGCETCLRARPQAGARSVADWRQRHAALLAGASRVLAPSIDCLLRYQRHFPALALEFAPHDDFYRSPTPATPRLCHSTQPLHIVLIGALGFGKGFRILQQALLQAAARQLPLRFTLIGFGDGVLAESPHADFVSTGPYRDASLAGWLARLQPDLVWFPAQVPETYGYTLSSAFAAGLPVVTSDLGALAERLHQRPWSWLLPHTLSAAEWLDALLRIRNEHFLTGRAPDLPRHPLPTPAPPPTCWQAPAARHAPAAANISAQQLYSRFNGHYPAVDISVVSWNSAAWLDGFFASLLASSYPRQLMRVLVRDNGSSDDSLVRLQHWQQKLQDHDIELLLEQGDNVGFGQGQNANLRRAQAPLLLVCNLDLELAPDALEIAVIATRTASADTVAWEFRQQPYEHPKVYDPVSGDTRWVSGACTLFRTAALQQVGGFEPRIFLYGEDVELSYRLRSTGYRLCYLPQAVCWHYSYQQADELKPAQFRGAVYAALALRLRYGSLVEIWRGWQHYRQLCRQPTLPAGVNTAELRQIGRQLLADLPYYLRSRHHHAAGGGGFPFSGLDFELARAGAFHAGKRWSSTSPPLVSLILRADSLPERQLGELLQAIARQTYSAIELMIIGTLPASAIHFCQQHLPAGFKLVLRAAAGLNRAAAGNLGLALAQGDLISFIDGDALPYADHVETLAAALVDKPQVLIACSSWLLAEGHYTADGHWHHQQRTVVHLAPIDRLGLWIWNHLPVSNLMFRRTLLSRTGPLDERLDSHEDWNFWVRCSLECEFLTLDKSTTLIRRGPDLWSPALDDDAGRSAAARINQALLQAREPAQYQHMLAHLQAQPVSS